VAVSRALLALIARGLADPRLPATGAQEAPTVVAGT
jgi:hypothetical protein